MLKRTVPVLFAVLLLNAAFSTEKKGGAGYYYRDSLLHQHPAYAQVMDSLRKNSALHRQDLAYCWSMYAEKEKQLRGLDTTNWSPLLLQLKNEQLKENKADCRQIEGDILLDSLLLRQRLMSPVIASVDSLVTSYAKKNRLDTIFDRENQVEFKKWESSGTKLKNVHADLLRLVKGK